MPERISGYRGFGDSNNPPRAVKLEFSHGQGGQVLELFRKAHNFVSLFFFLLRLHCVRVAEARVLLCLHVLGYLLAPSQLPHILWIQC